MVKRGTPFEKFLQNIENIPVQGFDENREIIFWNQASEKNFGYKRELAIGQNIENLIIPQQLHNNFIQKVNDRYKKGQEIESGQQTWCNQEGDEIKMLSDFVMVENDAGDKMIFCLEVDVKNLDGLDKHFWQIQRLKSVGNLAAGVAEIFNNIFSVIIGRAQMAIMKNENLPENSHLSKILKASQKATDLNRKLLLFSRDKSMSFREIDLNEIIEHLLKMKDNKCPSSIKIKTDLSNTLNRIWGHRSNLEQVFLDIIENAKEAISENGEIMIFTKNVTIDNKQNESQDKEIYTAPGNYARILIKDDGIGIKDEIIDKIYDPFFTTKNGAVHQGMGLSVAYGIIKKHRGWINVSSEFGKGTTVIIDIPTLNK